jgi:hypothetical protein
MMGFPVFRAFGASVGYFFVHFITIFKILWLPALLLTALQFLVTTSIFDAMPTLAGVEDSEDPFAVYEAMAPMFRAIGWVLLATAIVYPMMAAGLLRHVVRGEAPRLPFYLRFGLDELRILVAFIFLYVIYSVVFGIGVIILHMPGLILLLVSTPAAIAGFALGAVVFICFLIWFSVRMSVVFAAGIGERKIGIVTSWMRTEGHFWGLFWYRTLWTVLLVALVIGMLTLFFSITLGGAVAWMAASAPLTDEEALRQAEDMLGLFSNFSSPRFWLMAGVNWLYLVLHTALTFIPAGVAYRYLTGSECGE